MTKRYTVLEKITGIVFTLHGIVIIIGIVLGHYRYQEMVAEYATENPELDYAVQSLLSYLLSIRSMMVCMALAIIGGVLLLLNKKAGWVLSAANGITQFFYAAFSLWLTWKNPAFPRLWYALAVIVFAASLFVLFSPALIEKYRPGKRMWNWVFGLAVIFTFDYILLMSGAFTR